MSVGCSKVSFLREEGKGVAHSTRAWNGKAEGEGDSNASWALKGGGGGGKTFVLRARRRRRRRKRHLKKIPVGEGRGKE